MFGWIEGIFKKGVAAVGSGVIDLIHLAVRGLYAFLHGVFGAVSGAWSGLWHDSVSLWAGVRRFANAVYQKFIWVLRHLVPYLESYIKWVRTILDKALDAARKFLYDLILATYHWALGVFEATRKWAVDTIFKPLYTFILKAWNWVVKRGEAMWHYFSNLADFAKLLMPWLIAELERVSWDAGKLLGKFFLSLIVHNVIRFASLMEDIVSAIL